MQKEVKESEKIKYPVFTIRLHPETIKLLKKEHERSGLSWNKYIYQIIKKI